MTLFLEKNVTRIRRPKYCLTTFLASQFASVSEKCLLLVLLMLATDELDDKYEGQPL